MADILELILANHHYALQLAHELGAAAALAGEGSSGADWLVLTTWTSLAALIEAHTAAEEEICFPHMFLTTRRGLAQMDAAAADHGDIREALEEARLQPPGTSAWWQAVTAALASFIDHIDREEETILAGFRRRASAELRDRLGAQWCAFVNANWSGRLPPLVRNADRLRPP